MSVGKIVPLYLQEDGFMLSFTAVTTIGHICRLYRGRATKMMYMNERPNTIRKIYEVLTIVFRLKVMLITLISYICTDIPVGYINIFEETTIF